MWSDGHGAPVAVYVCVSVELSPQGKRAVFVETMPENRDFIFVLLIMIQNKFQKYLDIRSGGKDLYEMVRLS